MHVFSPDIFIVNKQLSVNGHTLQHGAAYMSQTNSPLHYRKWQVIGIS